MSYILNSLAKLSSIKCRNVAGVLERLKGMTYEERRASNE